MYHQVVTTVELVVCINLRSFATISVGWLRKPVDGSARMHVLLRIRLLLEFGWSSNTQKEQKEGKGGVEGGTAVGVFSLPCFYFERSFFFGWARGEVHLTVGGGRKCAICSSTKKSRAHT